MMLGAVPMQPNLSESVAEVLQLPLATACNPLASSA